MTQRDTAVAARLSTNGYRSIEEGQRVRTSTLEAAERALGWKPGSARAILNGGEPELIESFVPTSSGVVRFEPKSIGDTGQIPAALRALLLQGEVLEIRTERLGDNLRAVIVGVVDQGLEGPELVDAFETFEHFIDAVEEDAVGDDPLAKAAAGE